MTAQVERTFEIPVPCERVWAFIADPAKRAGAISAVERFELDDPEGTRATWYVSIPLIGTEMAVRTKDQTRDPPHYVQFVGKSRAMDVTGEHRLEPTDDGCSLYNRFVVDGHLPGVERYFKRNLDREISNLERALRADLSAE